MNLKFIAVAVALVLFTSMVTASLVASPPDFLAQFSEFKKTYGKTYFTQQEESRRFDIFVANMLAAAGTQEVNPLATFGMNKFSDMTVDEFRSTHRNAAAYFAARADEPKDLLNMSHIASSAGQSVNWVTNGAVTGVKDQGNCGGCWSFSSTGNIEGQWFIAKKSLVSLSEQELISCDNLNSGCNGGLEYSSWKWLITKQAGQIMTESSYPYKSGSGNVPACSLTGKAVGAKITSYKNLAAKEQTVADFMLLGGPVSVGVDATSWISYTSGILTNCISKAMDHSVLAVGFDDKSTPPYWIVKNSWGSTWGEQGYIRIAKGSNQCLIANDPSTSIV